MTQRQVTLEGGVPWGFRIHGGADLRTPVRVSRVNPGSKAEQRGIREGDLITSINGESTQNLTNNEAHNLIKSSGSILRLGLNEDTEGSPKKRHYRTIHHETHQETVKRSSISYTLKETIERSSSRSQNNEFEAFKPKDFINGRDTKQNGGDIKVVTNIPVSQVSTSSSSSTSTASTLVPERKNISSDHAIASSQSSYSNCSSIPDEGPQPGANQRNPDPNYQEMNDGQDRMSKSKKRRQRRKNLLFNRSISQESQGQSHVEIDEIDQKEYDDVVLEPLNKNLEILRLKRIEHKYKVESPKELGIEHVVKSSRKKLKIKSKSLDDDEDLLKIQELSEASESEEPKCQAHIIITEASSEENLLEEPDSPHRTLQLNLHNPSEPTSHISPEEEQALRNFLGGLNLVNSPEESAKDLYERTTKKQQKRKELEEYFKPIADNPRYLDAISEEASDMSDKESGMPKKTIHHLKQGTPEHDLAKQTVLLLEEKDSCEASPLSIEDTNRHSHFGKDYKEVVTFSQLTPPPTPDGVTAKANLAETRMNFDYTRMPNILKGKEPAKGQVNGDGTKYVGEESNKFNSMSGVGVDKLEEKTVDDVDMRNNVKEANGGLKKEIGSFADTEDSDSVLSDPMFHIRNGNMNQDNDGHLERIQLKNVGEEKRKPNEDNVEFGGVNEIFNKKVVVDRLISREETEHKEAIKTVDLKKCSKNDDIILSDEKEEKPELVNKAEQLMKNQKKTFITNVERTEQRMENNESIKIEKVELKNGNSEENINKQNNDEKKELIKYGSTEKSNESVELKNDKEINKNIETSETKIEKTVDDVNMRNNVKEKNGGLKEDIGSFADIEDSESVLSDPMFHKRNGNINEDNDGYSERIQLKNVGEETRKPNENKVDDIIEEFGGVKETFNKKVVVDKLINRKKTEHKEAMKTVDLKTCSKNDDIILSDEKEEKPELVNKAEQIMKNQKKTFIINVGRTEQRMVNNESIKREKVELKNGYSEENINKQNNDEKKGLTEDGSTEKSNANVELKNNKEIKKNLETSETKIEKTVDDVNMMINVKEENRGLKKYISSFADVEESESVLSDPMFHKRNENINEDNDGHSERNQLKTVGEETRKPNKDNVDDVIEEFGGVNKIFNKKVVVDKLISREETEHKAIKTVDLKKCSKNGHIIFSDGKEEKSELVNKAEQLLKNQTTFIINVDRSEQMMENNESIKREKVELKNGGSEENINKQNNDEKKEIIKDGSTEKSNASVELTNDKEIKKNIETSEIKIEKTSQKANNHIEYSKSETKKESVLKHVIMTSKDSNKTDSQKLFEFESIKKLNNEIKDKINKQELIGPAFKGSSGKNEDTVVMRCHEELPGKDFVQRRVKEFENSNEELKETSVCEGSILKRIILPNSGEPVKLECERLIPIKLEFSKNDPNKEIIIPIKMESINIKNNAKDANDLAVENNVIEIEKQRATHTENDHKVEHIIPIKIENSPTAPDGITKNDIRNINESLANIVEGKPEKQTSDTTKTEAHNEPPTPPPRRSKAFLLRKRNEETIPVSSNMTYTNILSPPRAASASSDSSTSEGSSRCTAKYNPSSSSIEENIDAKATYEPMSLRDIVLKRLMSLPFGDEILKELAEVSKAIDSFTNKLPFKGLNSSSSSSIANANNNNNILACGKNESMPWYTQSGYGDERRRILEFRRKFLTAKNRSDANVTRETEVTSPNRLLTIIREEPNESEPPSSDYLYYEDNADQRLKAKNLGEWLTLARHKSKSTSNLDRTNIPINNLRRRTENEPLTTRYRRLSLPQEIYEEQLITIMEKEREIQRELEKLEEEKRKLRAEIAPSRQRREFQVDDFYVSKKGDFAERRENIGEKKERPASMPAFPTEFFRQQMYEEYMDKFSEREERKQQKVVKISSSNDLEQDRREPQLKTKEIIHPIQIEREFMDRVREKQKKHHKETSAEATEVFSKEDTASDEAPVIVLDGDKVRGIEALPPHLQEFFGDLATRQEASKFGIWSPGQPRRPPSPQSAKQLQRTDPQYSQGQQDDPVSPVWTPKSASSSPTVERKEFKPVNFQSPVLSRKNRTRSETIPTSDSTTSGPPWRLPEGNSDSALNVSSTLDRRLPTSQSSPGFGFFSTAPRLPKAQNPTITLLQKAREGQLPRGAHYIDQDRRPPNDRPPIKYPGEVLYQIKNEYTSESDSEKPRKMADLTPRKFEGIGPTTKDGMPLILRSEVKDKDQSKWYKRMYDTIHKQKPHKDEFITVRYKQKRAHYPYASGYLSEPEPGAYDSDFTEYKYQTLDRRRTPQTHHYININNSNSATMPRSVPDSRSYSSSDIIRNNHEKYNNQPGRIENYRPGHSSISEKEAKQWWDEVMDIFDGHLEQQSRVPAHKPRSFINQALKESGYESDSTLVFKRKQETAASQLSPKEQREAYKIIQKGGDVPFQGLRKPAPERPRETDLVEFFPISPTLTKIRIHKSIIPPKEFVVPENEFFCYPATVHQNSPKVFANFKRTAPSSSVNFEGVSKTPPPSASVTPPPSPPKRKSSRNNSTLRLISTMKVSPTYKRHETCFTSGPKVSYLKDKLSPLATKKVAATKKMGASPRDSKQGTNKAIHKSGSTGSIMCKRSSTESLSSRVSSPVRTFGTEKKKFDLTLPILSPKSKLSKELLSPTEVKKGIKNIHSVSKAQGGKSMLKASIKISSKQSLERSRMKSTLEVKKSPVANPKPKVKINDKKTQQKSKKDQINDTLKKGMTTKCVAQKYIEAPSPNPIESNHFFRNLFLRNLKHSDSTVLPKNPWLTEKTNQLNRRRTSASEPSIGAMKIYLKHTRPVSDSKFISSDIIRSRSASPKSVTFSDETNGAHKRSKSLPSRSPTNRTPKLVFTQTSRPVSPVVVRKATPKRDSPSPHSRPLSPIVPRSPSSRRIMQLRQQKTYDKPQELLTLYSCPELKHSTTSLDSFRSDDYHVYLKDFVVLDKSEKFKELSHFYNDIEKVNKLEQKFASKPRKTSENHIIDYDRWIEVRTRERAEDELKYLYRHIKDHEKEKGFLFLPKDVERYKWKKELDRGLRIKEKSVENIKEEFERLKEEESDRECARRRELAYCKDTYKPLWRGTSVINLASILTERRSQSEGRFRTARQKLLIESEKIFSHKIGSRLWSSLSTEQVDKLKKQLQDIYSDETPSPLPKNASEHIVEVSINQPKKIRVPQLTVRRNSESSKPDLMSEDEKKLISQTLSKEVLEKISRKRKEDKLALPLVVGKEVLGAVATKEANVKKEEPPKALIKTNAVTVPASETESASTDESTKTIINLQDVQKKVEYFEKAKELDTYVPTVYKPAEDGSSEEATSPTDKNAVTLHQSKSCQNLKEYFGESELVRFATLPLSATKKSSYIRKPQLRALDLSPIRTISETNSIDSLNRSRSTSPYSEEAQALTKKGEVQKLRRHFEYFEDFFGEKKLKRSSSENDLRAYGHVDDLRRKYEYPAHSGRGRSRVKRGGMVSPVWLRPEDRYMPHINIISKIASLYSFSKQHGRPTGKEASKSMEELAEILGCPVGEVEKMKEKFDKMREQEEISLMGHMYTSSPNLRELRDITPYLTANWIAHKYPRSEDNTRSLSSPETSVGSRDTSIVRRDRCRPKSASPSKKGTHHQSILKRHRATERFETSSRYTKEPDLPPPPPPPKSQGGVRSQEQESPRKYVENEVTIHYKTPVRTEIKEYVSEDELAHRQAEAMKKIYEEERRRKYLQVSKSLQELQDMKSRRHTDNFIPSQKSPIPLNRYDDFDDLATPTKARPRSPEPRLVARALYNFLGQTARELTFRKGDLIYVRRQVDKNWYEGELNAMVGLFPVNYVEIVPYEGIKTTPRKAHEGQARAKYNFVAQTHLELSLAKGELVTITRRVDGNWFEGKIGGRKGIFPVSYVDVLIDPSEPPPSSSKPVAAPAAHSLLLNGSAQGKESMGSHLYTPNVPNPITSRDNNGYHHAKPIQLTGAGTYSTLPKHSRSPIDQALHIETQSEPIPYRALYKYAPQNDDELELLEGDTVYVLEKCDDGWYVGSSDRTGAFGTFPGNYVEKI